jgi:hypothetical protein
MKRKFFWKIATTVAIILVVTCISWISNENWVLLFYTTILALFVPEIKERFKLRSNERIRLSYSYLFCIESNGRYLLVKDAQGRNQYQPVGGVYKYDSQEVDLRVLCDGVYDNVFDINDNLIDDLRIVISTKKLKAFNAWFKSGENRENLTDLSREFSEELLESGILAPNLFEKIDYTYIGSHTETSYNETLHMKQIRHFDIVALKPGKQQQGHLTRMIKNQSKKFIFAKKDDIERGSIEYLGNRYTIAEHSKLIIVGGPIPLEKEHDQIAYSAKIEIDRDPLLLK